MKKLILFLLVSACAFGQANYFGGVAQTSRSVAGVTAMVPLPFASVFVCNYPGACTVGNAATIYTDATGVTVISGSIVTADANGNFGFWAAPGTYQYIFTFKGVTFGPFPTTIGGATIGAIPRAYNLASVPLNPTPSDGTIYKILDNQRGYYQYDAAQTRVRPISGYINVADFGITPLDYSYQQGGNATGGTNIVSTSGVAFPCTSAQVGKQLWLAASGTAAADTTYAITGCSGSNYQVSPNVVTTVSAVALAIGKQIDSSPAMATLLSYCTSMSGNTQKGCTIVFPEMAAYAFASTIQISGYGPAMQKVRMECAANEGATQLKWIGPDKGALIKVGSATTNDFPSFEMSNCTLGGIDPFAHRPDAIYLFSAGTNTSIYRNHFASTWHAVRITNSFFWTVVQNYFQGSSASCIYFDNSGGGPPSNSTIRDNEINACGSAAASPDGWAIGDFSGAAEDTIRVINNDFEGGCCYNGMIRLLGSTPQVIGNRNEVTGPCIADGSWRDLLLSGGTFGGAYVAGNEFTGALGSCAGALGQYNAEITGGTQHTFIGNLWSNASVTPVRLVNGTGVKFWETNFTPNSFTGSLPSGLNIYSGVDTTHQYLTLPGIVFHGFDGVGPAAGQYNGSYITGSPSSGGFNGVAGLGWASWTLDANGRSIPVAAVDGAKIFGGMILFNNAYNFGAGQPKSQVPFYTFPADTTWNQAGNLWNQTPQYGEASKCFRLDGTSVPASGTWQACDFIRNTNPSTGIYGWLCTSGGTPGTWQTIYTSPNGPATGTVASGTATMTTAAIAAGACGTTVTVAGSGIATTDAIAWSYNAAPAANPAQLVVSSWPTSGNVNFQYCNPTAGSITPTAATLNWRVTR